MDNPECQLAVDDPYYIKVWIIHIKLLLSTYLDYPLEYLMHGASSQIGSSTIKYLVRYINKTTLVIPKRYLNSDSLACPVVHTSVHGMPSWYVPVNVHGTYHWMYSECRYAPLDVPVNVPVDVL